MASLNTKPGRQQAILQIIAEREISSLAQLETALRKQNIHSDISTLSRDIKEMRIAKISGTYQAGSHPEAASRIIPAHTRILRQFIISFEAVDNQVVIRTLPGSANTVAILIDDHSEEFDSAGSIAGDDTVFVLLRSREAARRITGWLAKRTGSPEEAGN